MVRPDEMSQHAVENPTGDGLVAGILANDGKRGFELVRVLQVVGCARSATRSPRCATMLVLT